MDNTSAGPGTPTTHAQLLVTLEGLLAIQATDTKSALNQASQLINDTLRADKADVFLYESAVDTLVAMGTSDTPMGRKEIALGLDRLAMSNGGKAVAVFQTGVPYLSGHVEQDPDELRGIKDALGIRSAIVVPLAVNGVRRGVLQVDTAQPDRFTEEDVRFLEAAANWVGLVLHRAELVERISQEAAEQARSVAADELITILAHDLRAPLTALKGRVLMLQMRARQDGHQAYLQEAAAMQRATNRLERMIADLMDTARLEQGIFTLTPTVVDLAALARETAATLQTEGKEIVVRAPAALAAEVDPDRVRQVLENLLENARRHSPQGVAVILEVGTEVHEDGNWAVVTVRDFGPGIAPELLPNIFARFAVGRGTKGLGLGLYLARGIAEAHGGTLTVSSSPGAGATFRFALPLPKAQS
ncbi:MAG: histidine kinase, partial [Chloroflexi bacterium]